MAMYQRWVDVYNHGHEARLGEYVPLMFNLLLLHATVV